MPALVETMFWYGETPWHGLGKEVLSTLTAEEAIKVAGLNWEVEVVPVIISGTTASWRLPTRPQSSRRDCFNLRAMMKPFSS